MTTWFDHYPMSTFIFLYHLNQCDTGTLNHPAWQHLTKCIKVSTDFDLLTITIQIFKFSLLFSNICHNIFIIKKMLRCDIDTMNERANHLQFTRAKHAHLLF